MVQLFTDYPWLLVCVLIAGVSVICTAIVFVTEYLRKTHQAEIDASLKHEMLSRGMSAADIKTILEASADGEELRQSYSQPVRVGLGKFQVEVGAVQKPGAAESPARG